MFFKAQYEVVFLNFYADWCRFSQMLAPIFEEAAFKVATEFASGENKVLFAKVDCEQESKLCDFFQLKLNRLF